MISLKSLKNSFVPKINTLVAFFNQTNDSIKDTNKNTDNAQLSDSLSKIQGECAQIVDGIRSSLDIACEIDERLDGVWEEIMS